MACAFHAKLDPEIQLSTEPLAHFAAADGET
jgi:hypothetical protein